MLIYCKLNNNLQTIKIHEYSSLYHLKFLINQKLKIKDCIIEYGGKILNYENDMTYLKKFNIHNESTINIIKKIKGGTSTYMILLIILSIILIFIVIPLFLFSGFLPFIIHVAQLFILKIFNCVLSYLFKLPRIVAHKNIISFFVKSFMMIFQLFFMYFAINLIFTIAFFLWVTVLKGGDGLFTVSTDYCNSISVLNTMSMVLSIIFIIIYGGLKSPNLIFKSINSFITFTEKNNISLIFKWVNLVYASMKEFVYETKFTPFLLIPGFDALMEGYFEALDVGVNIITDYIGYVVQLGCSDKPIDMESFTNKITKSLSNNIKNTTNTQNLNFLKEKQTGGDINNDEYKCNLININKECCNDSIFQSLSSQFQTMYDTKVTANILKELGIYKIMKVLIYGLNVSKVKEDMVKFNNAFGPFKLLDENVKAPVATLFRYSLCNIFYLADFLQNTLFELGTPQDIADTLKCGFLGGFLTTIGYFICLIVIIFYVVL